MTVEQQLDLQTAAVRGGALRPRCYRPYCTALTSSLSVLCLTLPALLLLFGVLSLCHVSEQNHSVSPVLDSCLPSLLLPDQ